VLVGSLRVWLGESSIQVAGERWWLASSFICQVALVIAACSKLSDCSSASYWCSSYDMKMRTTCRIIWYQSFRYHSRNFIPSYIYIFASSYPPKSQKNILLRPFFQSVILVSSVKSQSIRVFVLVTDHLSFTCSLCLFYIC